MARISSLLAVCILECIAVTVPGTSLRSQQTAPTGATGSAGNAGNTVANSKSPKDTDTRNVQAQKLPSPEPTKSKPLPDPTQIDVPSPPKQTKNDSQTNKSALPPSTPNSNDNKKALPQLNLPHVNKTQPPDVPRDRPKEPSANKDSHPAPISNAVSQSLFWGAAGTFVGVICSVPALWFLNLKVLSKRPNADRLTFPGFSLIQAVMVRSGGDLAPQEPLLTKGPEAEEKHLADTDYALSQGYITEDELKRLRSSCLAISEMSFGIAAIGVAAAICFGIDGWAGRWPIGIASAIVVFSFTVLGVERYHKYRSSYKTLVLFRLQERITAPKAAGPGGAESPEAPPVVPAPPHDAAESSNA